MFFDMTEADSSIPQLSEFDGKGKGSQDFKWANQEEIMNPYNVTSNGSVEIVHFGDDHGRQIETKSTSHEIAHNRFPEDDRTNENLHIEDSLIYELSPPLSPSPSASSNKRRRSRSLVSSSWNERFQELIQFREGNDHCLVPHNYPANPKLSQWVRKQRHQRKRKEKALHSTLSNERQELLTNAGFIWDSHRAMWQERFQSLEVFEMTTGHCNVPSNFHDASLSNWVKNQRKQFKLFQTGSKTTMNEERINLLNSLGFNWNPRNL